MRAFENYFVFIILTLGTILADSGNEHQGFYEDMLILHNNLRIWNGASILTMDDRLSSEAMRFAENWIKTNENTRNKNSLYEYNFYSVQSATIRDLTVDEVFTSWKIPNMNYDYTIEPKNNEKASFTRMVWKDTKQLGLAKLQHGNKSVVVAIYFPAGNIRGQYRRNVGVLNL